MPILNTFAGSGGGVRIPLESPTVFTATPLNLEIQLTWTDPVDKVANPGGEAVATWNYTIVVRKVGSAPKTPGDGVEIVRTKTRNLYQSTPYSDTLYIENGVTYYYSVFAVSTIGVWSEPAVDDATPRNATVLYYQNFNLPASVQDDISMAFTMAANTANHAIFAGQLESGYDSYGSMFTPYNTAYAVDKSGTTTTTSISYSAIDGIGGCLNGNAFFGGGYTKIRQHSESSSLCMVNSSLSKSSSSLPASTKHGAFASLSDRILYAGGHGDGESRSSVAAYNTSLTRTNATNLSYSAGLLGGAAVDGTYVVFAGGSEDEYGSGNRARDAYDSALTRVSVTALSGSYRANVSTATLSGRAVFAGGTDVNGGGSGMSNVETYDASLTKQSLTGLSANRGSDRTRIPSVSMDGYAVFVVGNGNAVANVYNGAFTRTVLSAVSGKSPGGVAAVAENVAMFSSMPDRDYSGSPTHANGPLIGYILQ